MMRARAEPRSPPLDGDMDEWTCGLGCSECIHRHERVVESTTIQKRVCRQSPRAAQCRIRYQSARHLCSRMVVRLVEAQVEAQVEAPMMPCLGCSTKVDGTGPVEPVPKITWRKAALPAAALSAPHVGARVPSVGRVERLELPHELPPSESDARDACCDASCDQ